MNRNQTGIRARRQREIIFKLLLAAVINQVDAGINLPDAHLGEGRHAGAPLRGIVAGEIIDLPGQGTVAADRCLRIGADEPHLHRARRRICIYAQGEFRRRRRDRERGVASVREKLVLRTGFKIKRQAAERGGGLRDDRQRREPKCQRGEFRGQIFHIRIRGCNRRRTGTVRRHHYIYHA